MKILELAITVFCSVFSIILRTSAFCDIRYSRYYTISADLVSISELIILGRLEKTKN